MAADATQQVAADVRTLDQRALMAKYGHEAAEHRRILFGRGMGMCAQWRDFRQFLSDLGPAPDTDHIITRIVAGVTYAPGRCAWVHRDRQPVIVRDPAPIPAPLVTYGIWASVEGKSVEYGALARRLGVPMDAMAVAMRNGQSPEDLVQQAAIADELVKCDPHWLPPEAHRRQAFFTAFRMWHMQVLPTG
jgi:hypothetical protein